MFNTFTVLGECPSTGMVGAASCTGRPFVGAMLPLVRAGCGAVSSQALTSPYRALEALDMLGSGVGPEAAIESALDGDPGREKRQIAAISPAGESAAFTGKENVEWAGHLMGDGCVVAGNMLTGPRVLKTLLSVYEDAAGAELGERLLGALEAVDVVDRGDVRGKKSAVLYVVGTEVYGHSDIRVDEHSQPIKELRRLYDIWKRTQRPYQRIMPTRANPFGVVDAGTIAQAREDVAEY